jgi:hypothetical protein
MAGVKDHIRKTTTTSWKYNPLFNFEQIQNRIFLVIIKHGLIPSKLV